MGMSIVSARPSHGSQRRQAFDATALAVIALVALCPRAEAARVEAYLGEPFGVGVVTVAVNSAGPVIPLDDERFTVEAADGRALYPVVKEQRVRRIIRRLLEIETPASATIYFLFRGDEPLELTAYAPAATATTVTPLADPDAHRRLLHEWWEAYAARWNQLRANPKFPPVVDNFLAVNLSRRLGLALPEPQPSIFAIFQPKQTVWDDLLVTERRQLEVDEELLAGSAASGEAGPLPPQMPWLDLAEPAEAAEPPAAPATEEALPAPGAKSIAPGAAPPSPLEPIAAHVPAECFYVRFGTFTNYLWFRDLKKKWSGDLANMISRRGIDQASGERIEQQLALKENAMAKILGPQIIADVAIIGLDPYVEQGAAIGILFQAKNSFVLSHDITNERTEALAKFADGSMTTVKIAERDVSFASTPRGEIRSYYVADGDFHLVTTSRRLVERFLEVGQGSGGLADSAGFRGVRKQLPGDRGDAIFAYVSPEFIRGLTSPPIWIEAQRRIQSVRETHLVKLARRQAAAERVEAHSTGELIDAGMLPAEFSQRGDGSQLVDDDAGMSDSLRGVPGLFTPVSDMPATNATVAESAAYRRFADRFRQEVGQTPPIAVAVQRTPLADSSGESMVAEVLATPLDEVKLGKLFDMLGEPSTERVAGTPGDLIRAEAVSGAKLPFLGDGEPSHLFLATRDFRSPLIVRQGAIASADGAGALFRFYMGAWPKPGFMRIFTGPQPAGGPEPTPTPTQMWQGMAGDFLVICFSPELVREILPQLVVEATPRAAQLWVDVLELSGTELEGTINALGFQRARETSVAACRLMNTLASQLHVPVDECRNAAESLADGTFVCPLGGEYVEVETAGGRAMWTSSALTPANQFLLTEPPADFRLEALTWFKGFRGDACVTKEAVTAHVEIDMAKSAVP